MSQSANSNQGVTALKRLLETDDIDLLEHENILPKGQDEIPFEEPGGNDMKTLQQEEKALIERLEVNRRKQSKISRDASNPDTEFKVMSATSNKADIDAEVQIDEKAIETLSFVPADLVIETVKRDKIPKDWLLNRSKFIPLRLSLKERKFMRLVKNTMDVSEYTDRIDILTWRNKSRRIHQQLKEICAILTGLVVACDYKLGQELVANKDFAENQIFFQNTFEILRRYKILNPEKLRTSYGKMIHVLMDAADPGIEDLLGFTPIRKIKTVYELLEQNNALDILVEDQDLVLDATREIDPFGKPRYQIDNEIWAKNKAWKKLEHKYEDEFTTPERFEVAFRSISDNHSFLQWARAPVDKMIAFLKKYFNPKKVDEQGQYDLSISSGNGGARLSHSHKVHYFYVLQSLTLWRELLHEMFMLWCLAEDDLLERENGYTLRETGQGPNRIQSCPRIGKAMRGILRRVQKEAGGWVGSSVVHLGDHNVPNALVFIDKYNQVPRILNPIIITLNEIDRMMTKPKLNQYIKSNWGDAESLRRHILCDFFRHGFDGSGADNFYDAGSCIDGRLTSAWNWCENITQKDFYPVFQITGFQSFDGSW